MILLIRSFIVLIILFLFDLALEFFIRGVPICIFRDTTASYLVQNAPISVISVWVKVSQDLEDIWRWSEQTRDLQLVSVKVIVSETRYKAPLMSLKCKLSDEMIDAE